MKIARSLSCLAAGALLASCVAHGAGGPGSIPRQPNFTSHNVRFYEDLLSDRVFVFHNPHIPRYRNVPHAVIFRADGRFLECIGKWLKAGKLHWVERAYRWSIVRAGIGAVVQYEIGGKRKVYGHYFYNPETGAVSAEALRAHADWRRTWTREGAGWVQDSLPRSLADGCPGLDLPAGMRINEKQTSQRLDELRRQDPDAPIRNFPGSHLTSPGRTGLGASGGRPTTTKAEVEAFLEAQQGNVLISTKRIGVTYVRAGDREELWRIGEEYHMADGFWDIVRTVDEAGELLEVREGVKVRRRYLIGYPFPYLPTGHRHPAFQLTDEFLARPYPRSLPFVGEAYADKRFVFHPKGKFSVVDEAGNLVEGPHFAGTWAWTKGNLEMTVRNDPAGPKRVHWRILAAELGMKPVMWTKHTPDRID